MADFCYFCKKKISVLGLLSKKSVEGQIVCGECTRTGSRIAALYNREFSEYTLKDMGVLLENAVPFERHLKNYEQIGNENQSQICKCNKAIENEKKELRECEEDIEKAEKEYEKDLNEAEKQRKIECSESMYKEELKNYEIAKRRGDTVAINNLREILSFPDKHYQEAVEFAEKIYVRRKNMDIGFAESAKAIIDGNKRLIETLEDYTELRKYIYRISEIPSEKVILGDTLKRYAEEKSEGKSYLVWYLKNILKIEEQKVESIKSNDEVLSELGKKMIEYDMQEAFAHYYVNKARIGRMKYKLDALDALIKSTDDYDSISQELIDEIRYNEEALNKELEKREEINRDFDQKEAMLKKNFSEIVQESENRRKKVQEQRNGDRKQLTESVVKTEKQLNDQTDSIEKTVIIEKNTINEDEEICNNCGKKNKAGAKFCKFCGTSLIKEEAHFCTECGNKIKPGKKFCSACGAKAEN